MEVTLIVITIILLFVIFVQINNFKTLMNKRINGMKNHLEETKFELSRLLRLAEAERRELKEQINKLNITRIETPSKSKEENDILKNLIINEFSETPIKNEIEELKEVSEIKIPKQKETEKIVENQHKQHVTENIQVTKQPIQNVSQPPKKEPVRIIPPIKEPPKKTFYQKFREQNPDLEKFIGENLISKIGIIVLVLGIGYLVSYAIGEGYINEAGRIGIGILLGGGLLGLAHYLRKSFKAFGSLLAGGGIAVLYYTVYLAFNSYHIINQAPAFVILVLLTGFTVFLSIAYNQQELSVFAILGGFSSPMLVSTGEGNYIVLFTYISILIIGMLVLSYYKKWNWVYGTAFFFTVVLYGSWLGNELANKENPEYIGGLVFASLFYLIFFLMNILNNIKENKKFKALEIIGLISNSFFYFGAGLAILFEYNIQLQGIFTASLAIFNFIFAFVLYKKFNIDKNLIYLLIGLVLSFASLVAPIQLDGNYITLFWALEMSLLLWLSQKTEIKILKFGSILILFAMLISWIIDLSEIYNFYDITLPKLAVILNKGFITSFVVFASLLLSTVLIRYEKTPVFWKFISTELYKISLITISILAIYVSGLVETAYQLNFIYSHEIAINANIALYNYLFITALLVWSAIRKAKKEFLFTYIVSMFAMLVYMVGYQFIFNSLRDNILLTNESHSAYYYHFITVGIIVLISLYILYRIFVQKELNTKFVSVTLWFGVFVIVYALSAELGNSYVIKYFVQPELDADGFVDYYLVESQVDDLLYSARRIGFPVLWGVCAFILMVIGMQKENRQLRFISLTLIFITIFKLFAIDVWNMSEAGRIVSFVILGVILLVVSFLYQKLKKILLDNEQKNETQN